MSSDRVKVRASVSASCEFCARQTNSASELPLCGRCLAEMGDPLFAQAVYRALSPESRAVLSRALSRPAN
jgi:hypothetical protein